MSTPETLQREAQRQLYHKALKLLGPREHTRLELHTKLTTELSRVRKVWANADETVREAAAELDDESLLNRVLDQLIAEGAQSDARCAALMATQQRRKGRGPLAIRAALERKRLDRDLIAETMAELEAEAADASLLEGGESAWLEEAVAVLSKRWPRGVPEDLRERSRALQYLARRGFPESVCRRALDRARVTV